MRLSDLDPNHWGAFIDAWRAWSSANGFDAEDEFSRWFRAIRATSDYGDRSNDAVVQQIVDVFIDTLGD